MTLREELAEAKSFVASTVEFVPDIGLILGSGLGELAEEVDAAARIPYSKIPHFPVSTVPGHDGVLVLGTLEGKRVAVLKGRVHYYEGYTMEKVTFPLRFMKKMGIRAVIVTNAAGGINPDFAPGDLMVIRDHINLMGTSPLVGPNDTELGPRFPDLTHAYDSVLGELAMAKGNEIGKPLRQGTFVGLHGPNYETPGELRFFRQIGGDAVGMSTVPEVIVAAHMGLKLLGISCITNVWAPGRGADHEEVLQAAEQVKPSFKKLLKSIVREMTV